MCSSKQKPSVTYIIYILHFARVHLPVSSHLSTGTRKKSLVKWPHIPWIARALKFAECNPARSTDLSILFSVCMDIEMALPCHIQYKLTLRLLMSYIYIYIYIYMEHLFLMFLDHTQRRSTVGRTPLDE